MKINQKNAKLILKANKKYQNKNAKKYKTANLKLVKKYQTKNCKITKMSNLESVKKYQKKLKTNFPPKSLSSLLQHKIASNFCKNTSPQAFEKSGCAVCGKLTLYTELQIMIFKTLVDLFLKKIWIIFVIHAINQFQKKKCLCLH